MKFEHNEIAGRDDGGGTITVTAETPAEVMQIGQHFNIFDKNEPADLIKLAEAIKDGTLTHTTPASTKRPWFLVESSLDWDFTKPYADLLEHITGQAIVPSLSLSLTPFHPRRLCHTHITTAAELSHGHYCYRVLLSAEDWNGKKAADRAQINAQDYCEEDIGIRPFEREYIETASGGMKRNPDYLKRHRARPALGCPWLWAAVFQWWRTNHATPGQCEALDQCNAEHARHKLEPSYLIRTNGQGGWVIGDRGLLLSFEPYKLITWAEFQKL